MLNRHLCWLINRRRRNRFIIFAILAFIVIYFFNQSGNGSYSSFEIEAEVHREVRSVNQKKPRINRETYTTPEPCHGCPGENGAGVHLTVIILKPKKKHSIF